VDADPAPVDEDLRGPARKEKEFHSSSGRNN
jgi:hypothetical protein